jgi:hypothetical protein
MRNLLTGITVAAVLAFASTSQAADGLVDMTWNACSPVVQDVTTATPGIYSIFISVLGIDQPHQGYETTFIYADASGTVPDAWAFDPTGCQTTPFATIDYQSLVKACPSFQGTLASVQVKDVGHVPPLDPGHYSTNYMRVTLYNTYPPGILTGVNPLTRYFLMAVNFNHASSVVGPGSAGLTCGNFENPICFKMIRNYYLDPGGLEHPFGRNVSAGAPLFVTFNGGGACTAVPAKAATWGAIKSQYRN